MKKPLFKEEAHNNSYFENGYIKTNLLKKGIVQRTLDKILSLKPDDNYAPNRKGASTYHCTFLDTNEDYKRASNKLFKDIFNPIVDQLFYDYHVWNANLYVKPPGEGKFEIHQNWTHVKNEKDTSFTIWCPLVDTNKENGTIWLVEGSHKILPDIATLNVPYYFKEFENKLVDNYLKPIDCKAGDAVIFEDGVIHFSDLNRSKEPRYALQILIGPKNIKPVYYYYDKSKPELGFEVFEINDEFFMKNNYQTFHKKPSDQKSLGFVPNHNKLISELEFKKAIKNGSKRRKKVYKEK